jgi:hypothetical protein
MKKALHLLFMLCLPAMLAAQGIPQSMTFTVGTTARDGGGQDHAFLLWEAPKADLFAGKSFAIYGKSGAASSTAPFAQEGIVSGSLQPAVITACLQQAAALGQDLVEFDEVIAGIHFGSYYPGVAPELTGDRVAKTITVLTKLHSQPRLVGNLRTMIMVNPTLALCLGLAWSAPMPASQKTYELREWNAATSTDGPVIGRVTLTGGAPVILPAASRPVQVPDLTAAGDLKIGLRWGVPDALKRRIMLHQGYQLWRLPWSLVQSQGYDATPPSLAQLSAHISAGQAVAVTEKPLYIPKNLSPAQAETITGPQADLTTYLDDDLGRLRDAANYVMPADGAEFGYIVTPRDILGRPGLPSVAGHGRIVKTVAPSTPREPAVKLVFGEALADGTRPQHFEFSFQANEDGPANPTTHYEIYRGTGPTVDANGQPLVADFLDTVVHPAQPGRLTHSNTPPPNFPVDQQVWFCARAVRTSPAGTFVSPLSPPVHAALVNNTPPAAPVLVASANLCPQPGIQLNGTPGPAALDPVPDDGLNHFRMVCERLDAQVLKASFSIRRQGVQTEDLIEEIEFGGDDRVEVAFTLPDEAVGEATTFICRVHDGEAGLEAADYFFVRPAAVLPADQEYVVSFLTAVLTPTSLDPAHPVSPYFLNTAFAKVVETITLAPGARPAITAHVTNLEFADAGGFQAQRLIDGQWQPCGFAQRAAPGADDVVFRDDTGPPATNAAHYRLVPVQNLRGCSSGPTFFSVGSQGKANCTRSCMTYPIDPANEIVEYRFYRRVDEGPLTLFAEGRVKSGVTPNPICERDCNLPVTGGTMYYYGQVIAANGVGSVTVFLGGGTALQEKLPRPVLAAPAGAGTAEAPLVNLTWTCPAQGVDRFEVTLRSKGGEKITASVPGAALGSIPRTMHRKPPSNQNAAAIAAATLLVPASDIEVLKTDRVGSASMGSGPVFTWSSAILTDTDYDISVRALAANGTGGPDSAIYSFRWELPAAPTDPDVPWPFRALPQPASTQGEVAKMTFGEDVEETPLVSDRLIWPEVPGVQVGFAIGIIELAAKDNSLRFEQGVEIDGTLYPSGVRFSPNSGIRNATKDLNTRLYKRAEGSSESILPAVLYRQQITNTEFPVVTGDVVQVSPLISRLLWTNELDPGQDFPGSSLLRDPFIGVRKFTGPTVNDIRYPSTARLYLLDTTPRIVGASYRYWLVCFDAETGAPEYVIPATLQEETP